MDEEQFLGLLRSKFKRAKRGAGGLFNIMCPTCAPEDSKKMKRWVSEHVSQCWICGNRMSTETLLNQAVTINPLALKLPYTKHEDIIDLPTNHPAVQFLYRDHLYDLQLLKDKGVVFVAEGCGISIPFESGYIGHTNECIIFPVYHGGILVGWQARKVPGTWHGDRAGKMRYLQIFPKGKYLFNYDAAKSSKTVVVMEGAKKALKLPTMAVATLGKDISTEQIRLIQEWSRIVFMLDAGEDAQRKANNITEAILIDGKKVININPEDHGFDNPDEVTDNKLLEIITEEWIKKYDKN